MEAIILAGGKAERLGEAGGGLPKPLVSVAGRPLAAWQVGLLGRAGVDRVIVSCGAGAGEQFAAALGGLGVEVAIAEEPERLGRGGGIRFAAGQRQETGDVLALNGDELLDIDFAGLLEHHRANAAAATITVARPKSPFGVVELEDDHVTGFAEGGTIDCWVSCGVYVLGEDALARFPERGDHETTAFPALAAEGKLGAFHHDGLWLTVNTPKDLRRAEEYINAHPEWLEA
ncbi:MAG: nucleotidyltransferase family protein [Actinobacteria bacterium]|nr:MAG: nucleotidyltransferase family protein [Actinomycetota bacterium]